MAAVTPPIPLIATKADLEKELHILLGSKCNHGGIAPLCMVMSAGLMASQTIQTTPEFLKKLKDNDDVRQIVMDAMAEAWSEGYYQGYNQLTADDPVNPYKAE